MNILLNQPIRIYDSGQRDSNMPLVCLDSTEMQFQIQAEDIYSDYSDWSVNGDMSSSTGWVFLGASGMSITGGELTGTVSGTAQVDNDYAMKAGEVYRITVVVTENTGSLYLEQDENFNFYGTGTYQVIYKPNTTQKVKMRFQDGDFTVDSLTIELISDNYKFIAYLADESDAFEQNIALTNKDKNFLTYSLLFSSYGLGYDKYQIKILDPLTNNGSQCLVKNGYFANKTDSSDFNFDYTLPANTTLQVVQDAGVSTEYEHLLEWETTNYSEEFQITQGSVINDGVEYQISFEIVEITTATVTVYIGTNSQSYTTTGLKTVTLTCAGNTDIKFGFTPDVTAGSASIKTIDIAMTSESDYSPDYESSFINYQQSQCNHLEVRTVFVNEALGLGDGENFRPTALYPMILKRAEYEDDELHYTDSSGKRNVYFLNQRKNKTLETEILAEYQHDFLSLLSGFDNVYIDNVERTIMDQYTVNYINDNYGKGTLLVGERTQNRTANNKTPSSAGLDLSSQGAFVIDPQNNNIVDPDGNFLITP